MVNTLSGSVSAYRKENVKPRFIRIDEVMALLDVTRDEARNAGLYLQKRSFNNYRRIYNDIIEEKIIEGRQGIEQERYLTITIERKNFEEAKAQFATLEATIHKAFIELGAEIVPLNGNERLKVLYDYYHLGDEGSFDFDIKKAKKVGADFRNDLCNGMVKYFPDHFEDESKFCKALFIKKYPSSLSDRSETA